MRIAAFLTTDRSAAATLLSGWRARWPEARIVAFANDEDRPALQTGAPGIEFRRDKPPGGRLAFVRALRAERFDLAVSAWHGGERVQPMRIVVLLLGCRAIVTDERGRERAVAWWQPWRWGQHLLRRVSSADVLQVARFAAGLYRLTVGFVVAVCWLPLRSLLARLRP